MIKKRKCKNKKQNKNLRRGNKSLKKKKVINSNLLEVIPRKRKLKGRRRSVRRKMQKIRMVS